MWTVVLLIVPNGTKIFKMIFEFAQSSRGKLFVVGAVPCLFSLLSEVTEGVTSIAVKGRGISINLFGPVVMSKLPCFVSANSRSPQSCQH